jgi:16S rRNA (guanine966-N2)-methyltransferase
VQPFNIVFLDPPYHENILLPCCHYLEKQGYLAKSAKIYLESNMAIQPEMLPVSWTLLKAKKAGQVYYHLAQC